MQKYYGYCISLTNIVTNEFYLCDIICLKYIHFSTLNFNDCLFSSAVFCQKRPENHQMFEFTLI